MNLVKTLLAQRIPHVSTVFAQKCLVRFFFQSAALQDKALCKIYLISICSLFVLVSITILSYALILPVSQLRKQQLMTPQIRTHIEYLKQTYNIHVLILYSELMKNLASLTGFNTI